MKIRDIIYSRGVNPLPALKLGSLLLLMFFMSMVVTMIFSYLPKLVKNFDISEVNAGKYVGFIASSYYLGRILSSYFWGYLGNKKGYKTAIIAAITSVAASTIAFGFSSSYSWALTTRFLQGCCSGFYINAKSIMGEFCDDTNISLAMSLLTTAYTISLIVAPSISGFLVFPAEQFPKSFSKDSLFGRFGILLPNLIIIIGFALSLPLGILYLPASKIKQGSNTENTYLLGTKKERKYNDDVVVNTDCNRECRCNSTNVCKSNHSYKDGYFKTVDKKSWWQQAKNSKFGKVLSSKECVLVSILYLTYSIVGVGMEELFPLFAATIIKYNGLSFSTSQIGTVYLIVAGFLIILQIVVLPRISSYYGPKKLFIGSTLLQAVFFLLIPTVASIKSSVALWVTLCLILLICRFGAAGSFLAINLLINNSVSKELVGAANGFSFTFSSIGRIFAPIMFGSMYSWSLLNVKKEKETGNGIGFPCNQYFAFVMLGLFAFLNAMLVLAFPKDMDVRNRISIDVAEQDVQETSENTVLVT